MDDIEKIENTLSEGKNKENLKEKKK